MKMLLIPPPVLIFLLTWCGNPFPLPAQTSLPYLIRTSTEFELVGFPVHHSAIDSGPVTGVVGNTIIQWKPSLTARPFGLFLPTGQEYYAEVVGPSSHPWLGHRLELDENATRKRRDHNLVVANSPWNTRGLPQRSLAKAQLEVRQHLTVDHLWGEEARSRVLHGGESPSSIIFTLPLASGLLALKPDFANGTMGWAGTANPSVRLAEPLVIPPGSAIGVDFGHNRGSALGLTGTHRTWRTAVPLRIGANWLAYPFAVDMRLGLDWGTPQDGFVAVAQPNGQQDYLEFAEGSNRWRYSPESQSGSRIRWRLLQTGSTSAWTVPAIYLDTIPAGQGFILWKTKSQANHFFRAPQPN